MKLSKKKVISLALAVCLLAILSMGTLAWFTDDDSVTNNFYVAGSEDQDPDAVFSVDVWEDKDPIDVDGEDKIQDGIEYDAILPGDKLFKEVHIENTGAYDQYIRATVTVTEASIWQDVYGKRIVPLDEITNADLSGVHTQVAYYDAVNDVFVYELYYTDILKVGKDLVVFDTVNISKDLDRYQAAEMQDFQITVVADAVQTEHVGANVFEAFKTVGLVKAAPVSDAAALSAALYAEGEARIVLDPTVEWSITVDNAVSNKTIDFAGANGTIEFVSGASAENVVITGIVDEDGAVPSVKIAADVTGDIAIEYCSFKDANGGTYGAVVPAGANVTVDNCTFEGSEGKYNYGIYHSGAKNGNLTVTNSTFNNFGSWAIQINNAVNGNMLIDNCVFNTPDGVVKVMHGVNGNFDFTNNTLIGCKGHDGAGPNALIVSTSAKYNPLTATGTITYANNTFIVDGVDGDDDVQMGGELVTAPVVGDSEGEAYEGELFEPGMTDFLVSQNETLIGNANITVERTYNTVVLENVVAGVKGNLITAKADNTIILHNCDITLEKNAKLIVTTEGVTVGQVMIHNVTVNGELLTQATAAQYLEGVNWYEVW